MKPDPRVTAVSTPVKGRFVLDARGNHFVADATKPRGGPGEAPGAAELFLAGIVTCALAVIADCAHQRGIAASYEAEASYTPDAQDRTRFAHVYFSFTIHGVTQQVAAELVQEFKDVCPLYNTVARTAPVTVTAIAA